MQDLERCGVAKQRILPSAGVLEAPQTEVVVAALDQLNRERQAQSFPQERDVFLEELFLKRDGVRADDHTAFVADDLIDGRQQVCKGLSDARAGFHRYVLVILEAVRDGGGHVALLRARFVPVEPPRDRAVHVEPVERRDRVLSRFRAVG